MAHLPKQVCLPKFPRREVRVDLITTGECEHRALGPSLARVFPEVEFKALSRADSFTSADLSLPVPVSGKGVHRVVQDLASRIVAAVDVAQRDLPDLVLTIEDLELVNVLHPQRVADHLRDAVTGHLQDLRAQRPMATYQKLAKRVRRRCSFHIFAPMVEAYFFCDPAALERAGAIRRSLVDPQQVDVESFVTTDPDFLRPPNSDQDWSWAKPNRAKHPKRYLKFLCDPEDNHTRAYTETGGGCRALGTLDWAMVHAVTMYVQFARAMFEDLADALGRPNPFPGTSSPVTGNLQGAATLRNL